MDHSIVYSVSRRHCMIYVLLEFQVIDETHANPDKGGPYHLLSEYLARFFFSRTEVTSN